MRTLTKAGLAEAFDVSLPTVDAWLRRGCPYIREGANGQPWAFDLPAVIAWHQTRDTTPAPLPNHAQAVLEQRPDFENYFRYLSESAVVHFLDCAYRIWPELEQLLREQKTDQARADAAAYFLICVLQSWVLDDRFNTEVFSGDIDGVFASIGGRKVFTKAPTDENAVLLPPQWSQ